MKPATRSFLVCRGDSATLSFRLSTRNLLTGERGAFQPEIDKVEWTVDTPGSPLVKSTVGGGLAFDAGDARVTWALTPSQSAALPAGTFSYRIRVFATDGRAWTVLTGDFNLTG